MNNDYKDRFIIFIKNYISLLMAVAVALIYLFVDLIEFSKNEDPKIIVTKAVLYIAISTTITILLRRQGIVYGNMDKNFVVTKTNYTTIIDSIDTSILDDFCDYKNEQRKIAIIKKKLRWAKLSYDDFEAGKYEIILDKKQYSKRQLRVIKYCNHLEVESYDSDYLTKDMEDAKYKKNKFVSESHYLHQRNLSSLLMNIATSFIFAYLVVSLAKDISWANIIYSLIKVITWLASGVMAMVGSYVFVAVTYNDVLIDKTNKLKEYKVWYEQNHETIKKPKKDEQAIIVLPNPEKK